MKERKERVKYGVGQMERMGGGNERRARVEEL